VQDLSRSLIDKLVSEYNYHVVPIEIPFLVEGQIAHAMTVLTDAATLLPQTDNLTAANRILIALGTVTPATDFLLAQKLRQLLMQHLGFLWSIHPSMIIITPTTSCAGWPIKDKKELRYGVSDGDQTLKTMEYVWMANFTGLPALTVPAGFATSKASKSITNENGTAEKNVPVGLMGMAEWGNKAQLLQWGLEVEALNIARHRLPPTWVDVIAIAKQEMQNSSTDGSDDD
jgi:Asp-tRNA(Asn)/Glu-tRNA(Gln) amidotransferase A subunit family amidase